MRRAYSAQRKRTAIIIVALSALTASAVLLVGDWNQACGTGFGTVDWQRHIFAAQNRRNEGFIEVADALLNQAFDDAKRLGKQHPFYSITLRHLSDAEFYKFNFKASKAYALQELENLKPLGEDFQDLVPVFMRLSDIAYVEGNLNEAELYINKAKVLRDKSLYNPTLKSEIRLRLALIALAKNQKPEFRFLVSAAEKDWVEMYKEPKAGTNLNQYALEVAKLSLYSNKKVVPALREASIYMGTRSVYLIQKYQGVETLAIIWGLQKMAEIYRISNRPLDEIACCQRGSQYAIASTVLSTNDKAIVLFQYGRPLLDGGHLEEALPMLRQADAYSKKANMKERVDFLAYLSNCLKRLKQTEEAIATKRELVSLLEKSNRKPEAEQQLREIDFLLTRIK